MVASFKKKPLYVAAHKSRRSSVESKNMEDNVISIRNELNAGSVLSHGESIIEEVPNGSRNIDIKIPVLKS